MTTENFLNVENVNQNFVNIKFCILGPLYIRAYQIEKELQEGVEKPFDRVIRANYGDIHAMGQTPITFVRQLLALTIEPCHLDSPDYPADVKQRARDILNNCLGQSIGAYTETCGLTLIRHQVAEYIERRDGIPSDWMNIILAPGTTFAIKTVLSLFTNSVADGKHAGIMLPIPEYPLYSATLTEYGLTQIDYYLEEETNWSLNINELQRALDEAKTHCMPRALVIINPGNPTGQVLTRTNIENVIKFAYNNNLVILADEVYQDNIYDKNSKFWSFKKVLNEMTAPYNGLELFSFMSISKSYFGECGIRGGYMELVNISANVRDIMVKTLLSQSTTTIGQVAVSALVNPPKLGEPSYDLFIKEKTTILNSLKERADLVYNAFNSFEGLKTNPVQGAMYAFPQIHMPAKAMEAAKLKGMAPDELYAFELLESTGVCIMPGSGFGQKPGTYHFRTTILPQIDVLKIMLRRFKAFHAEFMQKYK